MDLRIKNSFTKKYSAPLSLARSLLKASLVKFPRGAGVSLGLVGWRSCCSRVAGVEGM